MEKEMAGHSRIPAWEILWTEEPGGPQSMGSHSQTRPSDETTTERVVINLKQVINLWIPTEMRWSSDTSNMFS